jgi:NTE family protein
MGKNVALALASGGARGLAHIGVIDELEEQGYNIVSVSGSSMGAVVGGMYAAGTLNDYKKWITSLSRIDVLGLIDFTLGTTGFIKGEKIFHEMQNRGFISNQLIENLRIPLVVVATDIVNNKEIVFKSGSLEYALRASVSIPNVITPIEIEKGLLVDGGVLNPLPINHLSTENVDLIIAVDINALIPHINSKRKTTKEIDNQNDRSTFDQLRERWYELFEGDEKKKLSKANKLGYFDMFARSYQVMQSSITQHILKQNPPDILLEISKDICGVFEFYRAEEIIGIGRNACKEALKKYNNTKFLSV